MSRPANQIGVGQGECFVLAQGLADFDRPIFFIELRRHYVCTWCETLDGNLILIPSQQSNRRIQHVHHPADATIVGRVTAISMDIVEAGEHEARA